MSKGGFLMVGNQPGRLMIRGFVAAEKNLKGIV
jgi:hypothetical protein